MFQSWIFPGNTDYLYNSEVPDVGLVCRYSCPTVAGTQYIVVGSAGSRSASCIPFPFHYYAPNSRQLSSHYIPSGTLLKFNPLRIKTKFYSFIYLPQYTSNSTVPLFADATLMYLAIHNSSDCIKIQEDLNNLERWESDW